MDIADMIEDYNFLGNEFLTWLWFKMETQNFDCVPGSKIVLAKEKESITIKGEESDLIIGKVALTSGFVVTEMNIVCDEYNFILKGSEMAFNGLKTPKVELDESEGLILENIYFIEDVSKKLDSLFNEFIHLRIDNWPETLTKIKYWVNDG